MKPRLARS